MKKLLHIIVTGYIIAFFAVGPLYATDYYACQNAQNINGDATWCTLAHRTGSCTGDGTYAAGATVLQAGNNLYANGCATITVNVSFTATKISNEAADGTAGGSFAVATSVTPLTITSAIVAGSTASDNTLDISGNANANPALTIEGAITGGSAASAFAVSDTHTVGTVAVTGDITGGSNASGHGYSYSSATGAVAVTGNCTGATGVGCRSTGAAAFTVSGNCTAGTVSADSVGCLSIGAGGIAVSGSIVNSTRAVGANGSVRWTPSAATKYVAFDGGGTALYASAGLGSDVGGTQITAANTAAQVKNTAWFVKKDNGAMTQGVAATGGGAWAF